ncbi:MAG: hypothetical protein U0S50_13140 [Sphingopyxis sp.]|uniref:hypothetical protein n=1 Tax=Sphingopyxis sp. TaxID=1908224 RepID=UPI002ABA6C7C|nr:hypothetical protein [Sphingopyxis sp.]MDZ3832741.1 hypothetical protein [Sphingopyxis sp.]
MFWTILMAAAVPPGAGAMDSPIVMLEAEGNGVHCVANRELCIALSDGDGGRAMRISSPATGDAEGALVALPSGLGTDRDLTLWPNLVFVSSKDEPGQGSSLEYLVGVVATESAGYSGGGGSGSRLHLLRFVMAPHAMAFGGEVLDVDWKGDLAIRACFTEVEAQDRLGACHDEYEYVATLTPAVGDGGELPSLTYRSVATAFPQMSRRWEDNSGQKLKKSDLTHWRDPECSYQRVLRYNPATARYEMDRPGPDCSTYTNP